MLLYFGPEVMAPLATAVAAVAGAILMFWRRCVAAVRAMGRSVARLFTRKAEGPRDAGSRGSPSRRKRRPRPTEPSGSV